MSLSDFKWTRISPEQARVLRYLEKYRTVEAEKLVDNLASETDTTRNIAEGALRNLDKAGLIETKRTGPKSPWRYVRLDDLAGAYIRANPYLGMTTEEAVLHYLDNNGGVRGVTSAGVILAEGTGYHATSMASAVNKLADEGKIEFERIGNKFIVAAALPGQRIPTQPTKAAFSLIPQDWEKTEAEEEPQPDDEFPPRAGSERANEEAVLDYLDAQELADTEATEEEREAFHEAIEEMEVGGLSDTDLQKLAMHLLARVVTNATQPVQESKNWRRAHDQKVKEITELHENLARQQSRIDKLASELTEARAQKNALQGRYNALAESYQRLSNKTREVRQGLPEEARDQLARLMKELPSG